ncbi:MAG: RNA methyltransferase [Anaerolineae bacterium]|nr:RNA methyltransferase [Anaerolineales bacterium]MCB8935385.1 RNA methyltransferase [Promineifilum sp.]MCW5846508.1 RNA methyltransferase [Anaerolineae bacterium]
MITSRSNPQVKHVRRLQADRRYRTAERSFVVEGTRWLRETVAASLVPRALFATTAWIASNEGRALLAALGPAVPVTDEVMTAMSDTETAPGVLAVLPMVARPWPTTPSLLAILDAVGNPGNLGTILRAAAAAGADGVLLGPGCVDAYNPKVVRGSMGAVLRLPLRPAPWEEIADLAAGLDVWLAVAREGVVYTAVDWRRPAAVLIGGEAHGAGNAAQRLATGRVTIPMRDETESLNAALAAGIILFEAARQRAAS